MTPQTAEFLRSLYADVDLAVADAGPKCEASGRCCRFEEYGHTLFLSEVEAEFLLAGAPGYDKPVSSAACPFQIDGLCTAREPRPLGCRIYFCDPDYQARAAEITESALARLKRHADEIGLGWRYAPLHVFLNEMERPAAGTPANSDNNTEGTGTPRVALPVLPDPQQETRS